MAPTSNRRFQRLRRTEAAPLHRTCPVEKPKILILDDSTSAVDTHTDACIRQALRDEIPDTTKFIIAQRVTSLMDADLILVLDEGKIHGMGTHEELLRTDAIYQEIYTSQQKGSVPQ